MFLYAILVKWIHRNCPRDESLFRHMLWTWILIVSFDFFPCSLLFSLLDNLVEMISTNFGRTNMRTSSIFLGTKLKTTMRARPSAESACATWSFYRSPTQQTPAEPGVSPEPAQTSSWRCAMTSLKIYSPHTYSPTSQPFRAFSPTLLARTRRSTLVAGCSMPFLLCSSICVPVGFGFSSGS